MVCQVIGLKSYNLMGLYNNRVPERSLSRERTQRTDIPQQDVRSGALGVDEYPALKKALFG